MLTGKELGAAIKAAMKLKGVTQQDVATEFGVMQPSVSAWTRTGRIDKEHLDHLMAYFADVVGPDHWGFKAFTVNYDEALGQAIKRVNEELSPNGVPPGMSLRAISLARRFDSLKDEEAQRIVYALMDNALQQFEGTPPQASPRAPRKPKRPPGSDR
jgi:transcriptional regulator with XRE-family HTH domain